MFYDIFVELCNKHKISPSKVAINCGFNKSTITNWKKKGFAPRQDTLIKIADYFGVTVGYLLGNEKTPANNDEGNIVTHKILAMGGMDGDNFRTLDKRQMNKWAELIDATRDLPPEKIDMLIKMAESIK